MFFLFFLGCISLWFLWRQRQVIKKKYGLISSYLLCGSNCLILIYIDTIAQHNKGMQQRKPIFLLAIVEWEKIKINLCVMLRQWRI